MNRRPPRSPKNSRSGPSEHWRRPEGGEPPTPRFEEAPRGVTLVVLHTAVLADVAELAERRVFAERAMSHCSYWISNEAPHVFPEIASRLGNGGYTRAVPAGGEQHARSLGRSAWCGTRMDRG